MTISQVPWPIKPSHLCSEYWGRRKKVSHEPYLAIPLHHVPKMTLKESPDLPPSAFTFYLWQIVYSFWANSKSIFMRLLMSIHSVCEDFIGFCGPMPVTTLVGRACQGNYTTCPWFRREIMTSLWPRTFPPCQSWLWSSEVQLGLKRS